MPLHQLSVHQSVLHQLVLYIHSTQKLIAARYYDIQLNGWDACYDGRSKPYFRRHRMIRLNYNDKLVFQVSSTKKPHYSGTVISGKYQ